MCTLDEPHNPTDTIEMTSLETNPETTTVIPPPVSPVSPVSPTQLRIDIPIPQAPTRKRYSPPISPIQPRGTRGTKDEDEDDSDYSSDDDYDGEHAIPYDPNPYWYRDLPDYKEYRKKLLLSSFRY